MRKQKNNRGYSLVEMIICIAIIAVVATIALISISLIHSARAKEAAVTVDEEIATLITKSKNMKCDKEGEGWQYAARIYYNTDDNKYYFQKGYYNTVNHKYTFTNTDPDGEGKGTSLSSYVDINFVGRRDVISNSSFDTSSTQDISSDNPLLVKNVTWGVPIRFNKDGSCATGYGEFAFLKKNGNVVATDYIRKNGSHQTK